MPIERVTIAKDYTISRIIKGGWHLAGGHGSIDESAALKDMYSFVKAGITTFDCADIYTGVEMLIGKFLRVYKQAFASGELAPVQIHTKYVPDYDALATLTKRDTEAVIDRSLRRLGVERLDLVQFAWWDYTIPGYIETASFLSELQKKGKIRHLGITNFDGKRVNEFKDAGIPLKTHQVQYSVLDQRAQNDLLADSQTSVPLMCYGTIAGGFLADRYIGKPAPVWPLENRSLVKYYLIIEEFGGWTLFQDVLKMLKEIGDQYSATASEVAMRYILQKPMVKGIIIGARNAKHIASLAQTFEFQLSPDDLGRINGVLKHASGPTGPVYQLERNKEGRHGAIMKYNLNHQRT